MTPKIAQRWPSPEYAAAELKASAPENVARALQELCEAYERWDWESPYPEGLLSSLLERGDPLIDLAIARYGDDEAILARLWRHGEPGLRHALVSNQVAGPLGFLREEDAPALQRELVFGGDAKLLDLFFINSQQGTGALVALFKREAPYDELEEETWLRLCAVALGNSMLHEKREDRRYATHPEDMDRDAVFKAIAELLFKAPLNQRVAMQLSTNLRSLDRLELPTGIVPEAGDFRIGSDEWHQDLAQRRRTEWELLLARWATPPEERKEDGREALGFQFMRESLACLIPTYDSELFRWAGEHEDLYVRRGIYTVKRYRSAEQVEKDFARDGEEFLDAAIDNDSLYLAAHRDAAAAFDRALAAEVDGDRVRDWETRQIRRTRRLNRGKALFERDPAKYLQPREERDDDVPELAEGEELEEHHHQFRDRLYQRWQSLRDGLPDRALGAALGAHEDVQQHRYEQVMGRLSELVRAIQEMSRPQPVPAQGSGSSALLWIGLTIGLVIGYWVAKG